MSSHVSARGSTASERRVNELRYSKDICLKAKARIIVGTREERGEWQAPGGGGKVRTVQVQEARGQVDLPLCRKLQ